MTLPDAGARPALDCSRARTFLLAASVAVVFSALPAVAADTTQPCAQVRDDVARLACYDQTFGKPDSPVTSANAPAMPAKPVAEFGLNARKIERAKPAAERTASAPETLSAAVTAVEQRRDGKFVATLDNGQVWAQSEINSSARVEVGDTVSVRRAVLGSYLLTTRDGIATRATRLR